MQAGGCKSRREAIALAHAIQRIRDERFYIEYGTPKEAARAIRSRERKIAREKRKSEHLYIRVKACATGGRFKKHCARGGHDKTSMGKVVSVRRFDGSRLTCVYSHHKNY
jgi:hypothetical protein